LIRRDPPNSAAIRVPDCELSIRAGAWTLIEIRRPSGARVGVRRSEHAGRAVRAAAGPAHSVL